MDARIFYKEARSLGRAGYDVSLLAPVQENGQMWWTNNSRRRPDGDGGQVLDGIRIIGFPLKNPTRILGLPKTTWLQRLLYPVCQWLRFYTGGRIDVGPNPFSEMIEKGTKIAADVYHCHEVETLYAGTQIKKKLKRQGKNTKLIYDVHEFPPASYSRKFRENRGLTRKAVTRWVKKGLEEVDFVITANYITRGFLLSQNRFINTEVIENCPSLTLFEENVSRRNNIEADEIIICHEGNLFFNRGLKEMLEIMKTLKKKYGDKVKLLVVGDALNKKEKSYLNQKLDEYQIQDIVEVTGWLSYEKVGGALSRGSIGIVFMEFEENNMLAGPPNKLFNYMRYGLPVIAVDIPETRRIVIESECGIIVKERSVDALLEALSILIENPELKRQMGENARRAVHEKYNWDIMEKKLLRIYDELVSSSTYVL
jgi:glycosyltransferase involved in cell wall biosynthesis